MGIIFTKQDRLKNFYKNNLQRNVIKRGKKNALIFLNKIIL